MRCNRTRAGLILPETVQIENGYSEGAGIWHSIGSVQPLPPVVRMANWVYRRIN